MLPHTDTRLTTLRPKELDSRESLVLRIHCFKPLLQGCLCCFLDRDCHNKPEAMTESKSPTQEVSVAAHRAQVLCFCCLGTFHSLLSNLSGENFAIFSWPQMYRWVPDYPRTNNSRENSLGPTTFILSGLSLWRQEMGNLNKAGNLIKRVVVRIKRDLLSSS